MATVESLARLTAGAVNPAEATGRSSSKEKLSSAEIAGFLKGLTPEQMVFAQAKYCDDSEAKINLLILTRKQAADIANRGKWKTRPSQIDKLAELAVIEAITPGRCKSCGGIGHKQNKACLPCGGTGLKRVSNRKIADALDVPETSFRRDWQDRIARLFNYHNELDNAVNRAVSFNSRND